MSERFKLVVVNKLKLFNMIKGLKIDKFLIHSVITNLCSENDIALVDIDEERTCNSLKNTLHYLNKLYMSNSGGRGRTKLLCKFESSECIVRICFPSETMKRKLEIELEEKEKKCKKLEEELSKLRDELKCNGNASTARPARVTVSPAKLGKKRTKKTCKKKSPKKLCRSQMWRKKKALVEDVKNALHVLDISDFEPLSVRYLHSNGDEDELILHSSAKSNKKRKCTDTEIEEINMLLHIKDCFCISNQALHEICSSWKGMPSSHRVLIEMKKLNAEFNIFPTPSPISGVQQTLQSTLPESIRTLISKVSEDSIARKDKRIRVKLSGDGTTVGKRLHLVNFTYTLVDGLCHSYNEEHYLAIFRCPEKYEDISIALRDIIKETATLTSIDVDGVTYTIDYFIGGDLKFMNMVSGIDSCCSSYSCVWCKCPSEEFCDISNRQAARSVEDISLCSKKKTKNGKFNCSHEPLFPHIPLDKRIPDTLHLFLRISDQLIKQLITELRLRDNLDKHIKSGVLNRERCINVTNFETFITDLRIPDFKFHVDKDTKLFQYRNFTGPEKLKIMTSINLEELLPESKNVDKI